MRTWSGTSAGRISPRLTPSPTPAPSRWLARQDWRNRWAAGYLAPDGSACCSRDLLCRLLPTAGPMLLRGPNLSDTPVEHASRIARLACTLHPDVPRQIVKPQVG